MAVALVDQYFSALFRPLGLRRGLGEGLHAGAPVAGRPATCVAVRRVHFASAITPLQAPALGKHGRVRARRAS